VIKTTVSLCVVFCVFGVLSSEPASAGTLPSGWATADVGAVGATGAASGSGDSFSVSGAGADIWGTADAFRFVYTRLTGDGTIIARVDTVQAIADWTKAGVMMRATLSAGSAQAMMLVSANKGLAFQRRPATGAASINTSGGAGKAPAFVRLSRHGSTVTASKSSDGLTWTVIDTDTIALPDTIYVGLAVSSHVSGRLATATFSSTSVAATPPAQTSTETIVFFRHGEKPSGGYGQITCQGLQRALALPDVLLNRFGTPQYLFAPNPTPKVTDSAGSFYYVRPLATIEPTAIRLGLPVNAQYGYTDITGLQSELLRPAYAASTVFVSWEHLKLVQVVQNLVNAFGGNVTVPAWPSTDYDSLYIVRLTNSDGTISAQFEHGFEGLNGQPTACP
jgi:hypothetical protein